MVTGGKSNRPSKNPHSGSQPNAKHKKGTAATTIASATAGIDPANQMGPMVLALNPHDVILGRGAPTAFYEGNVKFRALAALHKPDYMAGGRHHPKQAIAMRVLNEVHARGGRFVQEQPVPPPPGAPMNAKPVKGWQVVAHNTALEKVKQALRAKGSYEDVPMYPQDSASAAATAVVPSASAEAIQSTGNEPPVLKPSSVESTTDTSKNDNDRSSRPSVAAMAGVATLQDVSGRSQVTSSGDSKDASRSEDDSKSPSLRPTAGQAAAANASAGTTAATNAASLVAAIQGQVNPTFATSTATSTDQNNALLVQQVLRQRQQLAALRNQQQMDQLRAQLLLQQHQATANAVAAQQQQLLQQRLLQQQLAASLSPSVAAGLFGASAAAGTAAGSLLLQPAATTHSLYAQQLLSTPQQPFNWLNLGIGAAGGTGLNGLGLVGSNSSALGVPSSLSSPSATLSSPAALLLSASAAAGSTAAAAAGAAVASAPPSSGTQ